MRQYDSRPAASLWNSGGWRGQAGNHWIGDFKRLRSATNIGPSVGSFAWLAAWLSRTARVICQPQLGLLNPEQCPDIEVIPVRI